MRRSDPREQGERLVRQSQAHALDDDSQDRYNAERDLEGSLLDLARVHASGIATCDLMEYVRDIVDAADTCRATGTTQESVASIVADSFGAIADKEIDRAAKSKHERTA